MGIGGESIGCLSCESIFTKNQFMLTCNGCRDTFDKFEDFKAHFEDFDVLKLSCDVENQILKQEDIEADGCVSGSPRAGLDRCIILNTYARIFSKS